MWCLFVLFVCVFFVSSRRRHTRCALVTGVQTCALPIWIGERVVLLVAAGDARLDNGKAKAAFGGKAKMLDREEVETITGHPVGGVSPFGLASALDRKSVV